MRMKKIALIIGLLGILSIPIFTAAASPIPAPNQVLEPFQPEGKAEFIEYLVESVEFKEITVAPGETVSREVRVPIKIHRSDGSTELSHEIATFTLENVYEIQATSSFNKVGLLQPLVATTYVTCYGTLNQGGRNYTVKTDWHYNGTTATHDASIDTTFTAVWPYSTGTHHAPASGLSGGPGAPLITATLAPFYAGWPFQNKSHVIDWTLPHNSSSCTASGRIETY